MSNLQIHGLEDMLILESINQSIGIIGFTLLKNESNNFSKFSNKLFNYIDSFGYPYTIKITQSSVNLFLLISTKEIGELIVKVSTLMNRMKKLGPFDSCLIMSPLNHRKTTEQIQSFLSSKIKRTKDPKIIEIKKEYWTFLSLKFSKYDTNHFTGYIKKVLTYPSCSVHLSTRFSNRNARKKKKTQFGIMISFNSLSIKECKDFIEKLTLFSKEYQHKISCVLDFHPYHNVKNAKIAHSIGLTKTTQTAILWNNVLNLEVLIPNVNFQNVLPQDRNSEVLQVTKATQRPYQKISKTQTHKDLIQKVHTPLQAEKSALGIKETEKRSEKEKISPTLSFFGKEVTDEEVELLVKTIPSAPK